jgi:hypothetical protein
MKTIIHPKVFQYKCASHLSQTHSNTFTQCLYICALQDLLELHMYIASLTSF